MSLNLLQLAKVFRITKNPVMDSCDVLFVASPSNFFEPRGVLHGSEKLGPYIEGAKLADHQVITVLLPGTGSLRRRLPFRVYPFPRIPAALALGAIGKWIKNNYLHKQRERISLRDNLRSHAPTWNDVLLSVRPKLILGIGLRQDILLAAKQLNISTVEVQHGLITDEFMKKAYWPELAPDYFFVWDNHTADMAEKIGIKAMVTGHPLLAANGLEHQDKSHPQKAVAIAVTYDAEDSADPFGCIPREVFDSAKQLSREGHALIFRLHPAFAGEKLLSSILLRIWIWLHFPQSQTIDPKRSSVRDAVLRTDFLLTRESSLAFEFTLYGRKAIVTSNEARLRFRSHLGENYSAKTLIPDLGKLPPDYESPANLLPSYRRSFRGAETLLSMLEEIDDKNRRNSGRRSG